MAKHELMVQLFVDGQAVWQVHQDVEAKFCRKMTDDELRLVGREVANTLAAVVTARDKASGGPVDAEPTLRKYAGKKR